MEKSFEKPVFSRAILAALFSGIIATCTVEVYNIAYRAITHFNPSFIINVSSLIFGALIPIVFAGFLFYLFITYIKWGIHLFRLLFLVLCGALAVAGFHTHYGGNLSPFEGFPGLLFGVDVIIGIFIIVFIPYFFKHDNIYMD